MLDASAALELLFSSNRGRKVAQRIEDPAVTLHAPHLIDLEICQTLRRYVRAEELDEQTALTRLTHFTELGLNRYPHEPLLPRIWQLHPNLTAYDAAYVALAEALAAPLLTCDQRLANTASAIVQVVH